MNRRELLQGGLSLMAAQAPSVIADLIVHNARITTMGRSGEVSAMACQGEKILAIGSDKEILALRSSRTVTIDAKKRRIIPGLNDSHLHIIRGGLNYTLELRWDGVPSLADALRMLREQARRTPPGQWVRVVGGWNEFQFAERRLPTLEELNQAAPDTPVFVLHLYDSALLNRAALQAVGYDKNTPDPPGGLIARDKAGNPTGLLIAKPNAYILYATLAKGPKLPLEQQVNSTRHFLREMNRLGLTSCADAGGGFQRYPDDYQVIERLHRDQQLTLRIAYNLFTQKAKEELSDFSAWVKMLRPRQGDNFFRHNGAGEMLVFSAADFEDFLEPRPDMAPVMEAELEAVVRLLAENRWPFRLHATYNETISRALNVYERINRDIPLQGLHWFFDHAETIDQRNIERIRAMGGGIAIQHRMAFQGEYFVNRYGKEAGSVSPPIREMLKMGVPVGAGTDATRVASYNPWVSLYWLVSGRTIGGLQLYGESNRLDREEALRLWTKGSSWFSAEEDAKGELSPGKLADFTVLSRDYFSVAEEDIRTLESVWTVVGGRTVFAASDFKKLSPPVPPILPDWSPTRYYGGAQATPAQKRASLSLCEHGHAHSGLCVQPKDGSSPWDLGCACFAI
jgi:predicted amidohydrolase YtcJ